MIFWIFVAVCAALTLYCATGDLALFVDDESGADHATVPFNSLHHVSRSGYLVIRLRFNAIRTGRYAAKFGPYGHPSKIPQHERTASNESLHLGVLGNVRRSPKRCCWPTWLRPTGRGAAMRISD
jgi:hypothetical protein